MENKDITNFQEGIHKSDFDAIYNSKMIESESLINDFYRNKESLDGDWNFAIDQYDTCLRSKWYEERYCDDDGNTLPVDFSFETWDKIKVPSSWNTEVEKLFLYEGSLVYTRLFNYKNKGEARVILKFAGINYEAKVFLNKKFIGMHKGGSTPFYIEVTNILEDVNRILIVVNNTRKSDRVPMENTDWFNYGGIYRSVEILRLPETFIKNFYICLSNDGTFKNIDVDIKLDGEIENGRAKLNIDELFIHGEIEIKDGRGIGKIEANPVLWSPENPKLYDVTVSYEGDTLREKVGFREIKVLGKDILLNGEKIFLRGICTHEESVDNGKSMTEDEIRENFNLAKELNCNYVRLAHYPHSESASRIADEIGLMLWEEIPVYWAIDFKNDAVYADAKNQLSELIKRDKNRASVIIWSVGNENADTDDRLEFMKGLALYAKKLDGTRLVSAACLVDSVNLKIGDRLMEYIDVIGINEYYGWYEPDLSKLGKIFKNSKIDKPVIICEFGADAKAGFHGTVDDMFTEEFQREIYKKQFKILSEVSCVKGISPWILYDFRCPRRLHSMQNYYNLKGLLSADKSKKKLVFYELEEFYKGMEK
ncbi:MAG: glycoside hydrolase family 2 [Oscillospiraceae bacterium]|nr:glycoside hydrolase family 2 [Oscillospiraceae bacterium]